VSIATTVGGATAAAGGSTGSLSSSFGQSLDAVVAAGATYNNLRSIVTGGTGNLGTVATIMAGSNNSGSAATVTMAWRTRATNELPGSATSPPMNNGAGAGFLSSDVVQLNGIGTSGSTVDSYVLDMTYSSSVLGGSSNEQNDYTSGHLYLGSLSTTSSTWVNATSLNSGEGSLVAANPSEFTHLNESYPALVSYLNTNDPGWTLSEIVGAWGVETTNALSGGDTVPNAWAVVNHDSDFAVVPEPSTIALLIAGGLVLLPVVRRRLKKTA
jgi:hypothetical protein